MSRIGRLPVTVPNGVNVTISGRQVTVKGPKGELSLELAEPIEIAQNDGVLTVVSRLFLSQSRTCGVLVLFITSWTW